MFQNSGKSFIVLSDSPEEKEAWMYDVTRCTDKLRKVGSPTSMSPRRTTVLEGGSVMSSPVIQSNMVASSIIQVYPIIIGSL